MKTDLITLEHWSNHFPKDSNKKFVSGEIWVNPSDTRFAHIDNITGGYCMEDCDFVGHIGSCTWKELEEHYEVTDKDVVALTPEEYWLSSFSNGLGSEEEVIGEYDDDDRILLMFVDEKNLGR